MYTPSIDVFPRRGLIRLVEHPLLGPGIPHDVFDVFFVVAAGIGRKYGVVGKEVAVVESAVGVDTEVDHDEGELEG